MRNAYQPRGIQETPDWDILEKKSHGILPRARPPQASPQTKSQITKMWSDVLKGKEG